MPGQVMNQTEKQPIYWVFEKFHSIAGEGVNMGLPMLFIRFSGCWARCCWCDTKYAWEMESGQSHSIDDLIRWTSQFNCRWICLTGGNPTDQDLNPLIDALHSQDRYIEVQTNGTGIPPLRANWIVLSPKLHFREPDPWFSDNAHEVKWVICSKEDIDEVLLFHDVWEAPNIVLQPEWNTEGALQICIDACKKYDWRLSMQAHKYAGIR